MRSFVEDNGAALVFQRLERFSAFGFSSGEKPLKNKTRGRQSRDGKRRYCGARAGDYAYGNASLGAETDDILPRVAYRGQACIGYQRTEAPSSILRTISSPRSRLLCSK